MFKIIFIIFIFSFQVMAQTYIKGPALIEGVTSTASSGGTLTLTNTSQTVQAITGTLAHTVVMPTATTLPNGKYYYIPNRSTQSVTVNANGGGLLKLVPSDYEIYLVLKDNSTAAGVWDVSATQILFSNVKGMTVGSVMFGATGAILGQNNAQFFWDNTNFRLGIGTAVPSSPLDIKSTTAIGSKVTNTSAYSTTGGGALQIGADATAAITSTSRIGALNFSAAFDGTGVLRAGSSVTSNATELWTSGAGGSNLIFSVVPNTTTTLQNALTINNDRSATFATSISLGTALTIGNGGTGSTTKAGAFDALSPMSASGDLIYGGASGAGTRLAAGTSGNILKTLGAGLAPIWDNLKNIIGSVTSNGSGTYLLQYAVVNTGSCTPVNTDSAWISVSSGTDIGTGCNYTISGYSSVPACTCTTLNELAKCSGTSGAWNATSYSFRSLRSDTFASTDSVVSIVCYGPR